MTHHFPARAGRGIVPLAAPALGVRLWRCDLADVARVPSYFDTLSPGERQRAERFRDSRLRDRYVLGRGALRAILAALLEATPQDVPIERGPHGRPQLSAGGLDFNVSHTGAMALVGVADRARIGVDVERRDRRINAAGIARKFLSDGERARLEVEDLEAMRGQVLKLWTCKEAMSKATGDALSAPFAAMDVDLAGLQLRNGPGAYTPANWSLHSANAGAEHVATVALWRPPA